MIITGSLQLWFLAMNRIFAPITYTSYSGHGLMDYTEVRKEQTLRLSHQ